MRCIWLNTRPRKLFLSYWRTSDTVDLQNIFRLCDGKTCALGLTVNKSANCVSNNNKHCPDFAPKISFCDIRKIKRIRMLGHFDFCQLILVQLFLHVFGLRNRKKCVTGQKSTVFQIRPLFSVYLKCGFGGFWDHTCKTPVKCLSHILCNCFPDFLVAFRHNVSE